ncbi:hypothetical protein NPIL_63011 [Nephila pilipes]|uniref:Uncharacterized protein n=1 Tax=Nephila pilipes TaxID=299642 RepID=A0A8X6PK53_NEPPI|nr:hypothetical protein NPIL_63011 [Nephila pilipes]
MPSRIRAVFQVKAIQPNIKRIIDQSDIDNNLAERKKSNFRSYCLKLDEEDLKKSRNHRLTSTVSVRMFCETVDDGVDGFLEDCLGPSVGHRTRYRASTPA